MRAAHYDELLWSDSRRRPHKWGVSWQITPRALIEALSDPDRVAAKRAVGAMMTMRKTDIAAIEKARRG